MSGASPLPSRFVKMSGAGNDFVMFLGSPSGSPGEAWAIRRLCDRRTGVGADGVLFVRRMGADSVADYFNADGGAARFCANGTRCAARLVSVALGLGGDLVIVTGWGRVGARVAPDGRVTLTLPEPARRGRTLTTLGLGGGAIASEATEVNVGVPHLVVAVADVATLEALDLGLLGPPLRHHPEMPEGANVNFVARRSPSSLSVRTWERGVENETLACGSGAVASAAVASAAGASPPLEVLTRSGETLAVDFETTPEGVAGARLTGDARLLFEGEIRWEEWR
ncbi:MAG: diaminopimelate epimerase [Acidithiobacillales bacterium]